VAPGQCWDDNNHDSPAEIKPTHGGNQNRRAARRSQSRDASVYSANRRIAVLKAGLFKSNAVDP
jgi:hypothetical protein